MRRSASCRRYDGRVQSLAALGTMKPSSTLDSVTQALKLFAGQQKMRSWNYSLSYMQTGMSSCVSACTPDDVWLFQESEAPKPILHSWE